MEVMNQENTPNVLSRQTSILMGLIKPCFMAYKKKLSKESENDGEQSEETSSKDGLEMNKPRSVNPQEMTKRQRSSTHNAKSSNHKGKMAPQGSLTKEQVLTKYCDVFSGLGKFPGEPYKLKLKPDSQPARHRPRKVPVHLEEAFHKEIARLVKIDVLEPVTEHIDWVNSFVIIMEKDVKVDSSNAHSPNHSIKKKLRLCLDPKDLNEALE